MKKEHRKLTKEERYQRFSMTLLFSAVVFSIMIATVILTVIVLWLFMKLGWLSGSEEPSPKRIILFMGMLSLIIGAIFAFFTAKYPLKPVNRIVSRMNQLASGDFTTRLEYGKPIADHPSFRAMSDSFNKMAEELQNTEMLRGDFVNNFSHEFKTPIVSIAGFAKLLKRGNLTEEQRREYLDIIEEESMRLSAMATNVLNLTKIENQSILTDKTPFNVSEQIRSVILLLDEKWDKKHIELEVELDEYTITANEEMLREVWINLFDNAVKFTPDFGSVRVMIEKEGENIKVSIANTGSTIPPEKLTKIWNKFYQTDESHSTVGNGIGLAIVKKVVDLHGGSVEASSENDMTEFRVILPV